MSLMRGRTAHAAFWSVAEILARACSQIIVTLVLARLLTPDDFGLIAMLVVFTSLGGLLTDAGFGVALVQRPGITADDETTVFWFGIVTGTVMAFLLCLSAEAIAHFYSQSELASLIRVAALGIPLGAVGAVPDALLTKRLNFLARTNAALIAAVGSGALALLLAWRGFGVWSLVGQGLAASTLRSASLWFFSGWRPRGRFRRSSFHSLFGFGSYMLLSGILNTVAARVQSLMIGKLFDARSLGYYTLAGTVQDAPTSLIGGLLNRVGLPVFSSMSDRPDKLRSALRAALRISMFVFIPSMFGLALIARPLLVTLYGEQWAPAAPALALLSIGGAMWPLHVLNLAALNAQGRSDRFFYLEIFKNLTVVTLTLIAAPYGQNAVAGAMIVAGVCSVGINTWYSGKMLNLGLAAQLLDQRLTVALSILASIPAWCVLHWTREGVAPTLAAIAVAVVVYVSGALVTRHPALWELLGMLRDVSERWRPQIADPND